MKRIFAVACVVMSVVLSTGHATFGQDSDTAIRGQVTNLPLPRFVSLKAVEGNARRGPSLSHRIDWIFKHRHMPLKVVAEHGHWRRVVDRDGAGGWMHYSLLSGARTVLIEEDLAPLHVKPDAASRIQAYAELGTIARLGDCESQWCAVDASGNRGFVRRAKLWGADTP